MSEIMKKVAEDALDITKGQSGKMLERVLGPIADEIGLTLAESIRGFRLKKQIKLLQGAEEYIAKNGIKTKRISLKNFTPLLEYASIEEEETLEDKWKAMLINYADVEQNLKTNVFPNILSQMSLEEYEWLEKSVKNLWTREERWSREFRVKSEDLRPNLLRLGLLEQRPHIKLKTFYRFPESSDGFRPRVDEYSPIEKDLDFEYPISPLGIKLIEVCTLIKV